MMPGKGAEGVAGEAMGGLRAAVVGLGPMGLRHLAAWREVLGPDRVFTVVRHARDAERLGCFLDRHGGPGFNGPRVLADAAEIPGTAELAVVCTQTPRHARVALPLLRAGVHTLVEKPLAAHPEAARRLAELATARCFVAHTCRAESPCAAVHRHRPRDRPLRALVSVRREEARSPPPGTPGVARFGRLCDLLVHDLGAVLDALPPGPPAEASAAWDAEAELLDAVLDWGGVRARFVEQRVPLGGLREVRLDCGSGLDDAGWRLAPGSSRAWWPSDDGRTVSEPDGGRWADPLVALARRVLRAILEGRPSEFDARHGVRALELAAVILEALPAGTFGGEGFRWEYLR